MIIIIFILRNPLNINFEHVYNKIEKPKGDTMKI